MNSPPHPADAAARTAGRVLWAICLAGLAAFTYSLFSNDWDLFEIGVLLAVGSAACVVLLPGGFALGVGMRRPGALGDGLRMGGLLAGACVALLGWQVTQAGSGGADRSIGVALIAAGLLSAWQPFRAPRARLAMPPTATVAGGLLLAGAAWVLPKFAGTKEPAYFAALERDIRNVAEMQEAFHADSGRYAEPTDSLWPLVISTGVRMTMRRDGSGYRASLRHVGSADAHCAVFVDTTPEPPATVSGVPACVPYPSRGLTGTGALCLAALLLAAAGSLLVRVPSAAAGTQ